MVPMLRLVVADRSGAIRVMPDAHPAARSGRSVRPLARADVIPLPEGATVAHLPGRRALAVDRAGRVVAMDDRWLPVAAILPFGYLRTLLPASRPVRGAPRLPLFGYTAVGERDGQLVAAAMPTDSFEWWRPAPLAPADLAAAIAAARAALPGNRLVDHLSRCAQEYRCQTARNTFLRRYEGALPASPACNADCLGCISLQPDGAVPAPQERMGFAPTPAELADLAGHFLQGEEAAIVSFGQGCEGEPLTRGRALVEATARVRARHPTATIHVNTNGSRPRVLAQMVGAGCRSVRISAISFTDSVFRAYYRPAGYGLEEVVECGRLMSRAGGQVCLNLLTFPGISDSPAELERTAAACREMGVHQVQWRTLNVDHDWLVETVPPVEPGIGMAAALGWMRQRLPGVAHGNFTRPWPAGGSPGAPLPGPPLGVAPAVVSSERSPSPT
jgi:pyruvate-formate lyase-activating enzyme